MKEQFRHIGRETHRILGSDIVTGKAMYVADNKVPGMKYGKILRSPYPFARIVSVDKSEALAMDGVACVVTWQDIAGEGISVNNGFTPPRHPNILDEYVRYMGDAVALVVADSEDLAMEAMDKIKVEYEQLEPVYTIDEAMKPGAPQLYKEFPGNIAPYKQNLHFEAGDSGKGFEEADVIVEMDSEQLALNALPLEPSSRGKPTKRMSLFRAANI